MEPDGFVPQYYANTSSILAISWLNRAQVVSRPRAVRPPSLAGCNSPFYSHLRLDVESGLIKQPDLRRGTLRRQLRLEIFGPLLPQMFQNLADHRRVFHAGDDLHRVLALFAGFDVDVENPFQTLGPVHGGVAFGWRSFILVGGCLFFLTAPAPPCWCDQQTRGNAGNLMSGSNTFQSHCGELKLGHVQYVQFSLQSSHSHMHILEISNFRYGSKAAVSVHLLPCHETRGISILTVSALEKS